VVGQMAEGHTNGIEHEPMLRAWLQDSVPPRAHHDHRPGRWVAAHSWPPGCRAPAGGAGPGVLRFFVRAP